MAYYDHGAAMRKKERADKYIELKKQMSSRDGELKDWFLAHEHMVSLESELEQNKKKVEEYQKFFSSLQSLLPRVHSINDVIG